MKIIFDFDHTVFNMSSMHTALNDAIVEVGIDLEDYKAAYNKETNWKSFNVESLASRLEKMTGKSASSIIRAYHKVSDVADLFIYDDVKEVLEQLRADGHILIMLSWGDSNWQLRKIEASGLKNYFEEIITVTELKADFLSKWADDLSDIVVIDDKPAELKAIEKVHPDLTLVRMKRENGKYSDQETPSGLEEVKDMKEVIELINKLNA